ncbi:CHY zinc finger domain containing protein, putative [Babesia bigemina]|uniref:CHY zinc finger domain containing protein, putative n=1 Tax=Babesia bigemina TaxID=5866 RepID=A0A061D7F8_BABBI|nr:CHY zinc finger domain containing protein, putative [Babesia bigemina]CDR94809.1 CHY zinc finger domain containing protein, putative [Babesia bigemina]|eukprot:XP_012766995.1 CHY zinc finger domain containing protein, putative [Babesia bigemina]
MSDLLPVRDDGYVELFKLQRLFGATFSDCHGGAGSGEAAAQPLPIEHAWCRGEVNAAVVLRPTDPAFPVACLGDDRAIAMRLTLRRQWPSEGASQELGAEKPACPADPGDAAPSADGGGAAPTPASCYSVNAAADIAIDNASISHELKLVIKKVMLTFVSKYRASQRYVVYECLKFLDRELARIFALYGSQQSKKEAKEPAAAASATPSSDPDTWSLQEQKSLEFALAKTKSLADPAKRWAAVASVVKTKTAEECRRRFQRCREQLLNKATEEHKSLATMPKDFETVLAKSDELRLLELELEKVSVINVVSFVAQLACTRCEALFDATFAMGDKKTAVVQRSCSNCSMAQRGEFQPQIAFGTQPVIGRMSLENCVFRAGCRRHELTALQDLINGEFYLTCEACDTQCKVRDVQNGLRKRSSCRGCFASLTLQFNTVEFGHEAPSPQAIAVKPKFVPPRAPRPKAQQARGLKVGTPLPDNGACKHYRKSFRWFRFPCCGKLFPCDGCHDEASDHPYEPAHMIVCGRCSTQQPVSNSKCRGCDRGFTASSSSYWEGGKGCRDAVKLSRKDSKKYGLMRRQANAMARDSSDRKG